MPRPAKAAKLNLDHAALWVLSMLTCPLFGWLMGSSIMIDWTLESWKWRSIVGLAVGAGIPTSIALVLWVRPSVARSSTFLFLTAVVCVPVFYSTGVRLQNGPTFMKIPVDSVTCSLHGGRKGGGKCIRYRIEHSKGAAPLFADDDLARQFSRGKVTCIARLEDVVIDAHPCTASTD